MAGRSAAARRLHRPSGCSGGAGASAVALHRALLNAQQVRSPRRQPQSTAGTRGRAARRRGDLAATCSESLRCSAHAPAWPAQSRRRMLGVWQRHAGKEIECPVTARKRPRREYATRFLLAPVPWTHTYRSTHARHAAPTPGTHLVSVCHSPTTDAALLGWNFFGVQGPLRGCFFLRLAQGAAGGLAFHRAPYLPFSRRPAAILAALANRHV